MRKPTKKYFTPAGRTKSITMMRKWLDSGASPTTIVGWLKTEYAKADDDASRYHLGLMLCAAISSGKDDDLTKFVADRCAKMFGLPVGGMRGLGELALLEMAKTYDANIEWLDDFCESYVRGCKMPSELAQRSPISKRISVLMPNHILTIDPNNGIYFFRDINGSATLALIHHSNACILVDEVPFNDEPPLYFTESTHFVSPVWQINVVAKILDYILTRIGFPPRHIRRLVLFDSPNAELINREEYTDCEAWEGVEVVADRSVNVDQMLSPSIPVLGLSNDPTKEEKDLDLMFYLSIAATRDVVRRHLATCGPDVDTDMIERWCTGSGIFPREPF